MRGAKQTCLPENRTDARDEADDEREDEDGEHVFVQPALHMGELGGRILLVEDELRLITREHYEAIHPLRIL